MNCTTSIMSMRSPLFCVVLACIFGSLFRPSDAPAASISYFGDVISAGPTVTAGTSPYLANGYELFYTTNTVPSGAGGVTLTSLPTYVSTVSFLTGNVGAQGNYTSTGDSVIDNPTGGTTHAGLQYSFNTTTTDNTVLGVTLTGTVPGTFYIGYLTNADTFSGDYPTELHFAITAGPDTGADSGQITTAYGIHGASALTGQLDLYTFQVSGATSGDVITISGANSTSNGGHYLVVSNGLLFATQAVPEPPAALLLGGAALVLLPATRFSVRSRQRHST